MTRSTPARQLDELALQSEQLQEIPATALLVLSPQVGPTVSGQRIFGAIFQLELERLVIALTQLAMNAPHQFFFTRAHRRPLKQNVQAQGRYTICMALV
jgi:hypothetical protein